MTPSNPGDNQALSGYPACDGAAAVSDCIPHHLQPRLVSAAGDPFLELTLIGIIISAFLYGVVTVLFISCLRLVHARRGYLKTKKRWIMMVYVVVMFAMDTLAFVQQTAQIIELIFRPARYYASEDGLGSFIVSLVVLFVILGADYLMVWRCVILYQTTSRGLRIFTFILLGFIALASIGVLTLSIRYSDKLIGAFLDIPLALSLINNALLAVLITARILYHERKIQRLLGVSHQQSPYTRVIAICVESCVLMILIHGIYIALSFEQANGSMIPYAMLPHISVFSAFLLTYQVARKRSATTFIPPLANGTRLGVEHSDREHRTTRHLTTLRFDPGPMTDHSNISSSHEMVSREQILMIEEGGIRANMKGIEEVGEEGMDS